MNKKAFLIFYKLFFALLGFSALVTEAVVLLERGTFNAINFFSFFTVQVNIIVFVTLLLSAVFVALNKSKKLDALRTAVTVYIVIVGIGFSILLAGLEGVALTAVPWDNTVLHYIIPVAVVIDYLLDRPTTKLRFKKLLVWLLYPLAYITYTMIRGSIVGWYPYPFLNPANSTYMEIGIAVLGLFALGTILFAIAAKFAPKHK